MRIITVSTAADERKELAKDLKKILPHAEVLDFEDSFSALAAAREIEIDAAFISTDMPEMGGMELGQYLKDLYPYINLIFMAENPDRGYDALKLHASGYILKPLSEKLIDSEMSDLRYPEVRKKLKRVFVQTFGNFELFVDGKPVSFKYNRTKELIAILVNNRGAQTTNGEIIASMWEDDGDPEKKTSYLCNLRQDLMNTFTRLKVTDIIIKQRGSMAIATDRIECDLYDWLEKKKDSKYHYLGDYMNQYSWPEYRHAELDEISYALYDD